ncbi:MAG: FAD-binding protein [Lyngbya sp.]|nr:FAD-binding protein [Lyngbya sp.]
MENKKPDIKSLTARNLSYYRTLHNFDKYGEFYNVEEFFQYYRWAKERKIKIYILGNGSNTLFIKKRVKSLILKNKLEKEIQTLPDNRVKVSSSTLVMDILKYCLENSFDSFYYLASVPATVGGALAMNAGRGYQHRKTIYDFVENVTFFDPESDSIKVLEKEEIIKGYRETIFTGIQSRLILSATFKFDHKKIQGNPIAERCRWSKENQDYSGYNCGSVFKESDREILTKLRGIKIGEVCFSEKVNNWISNKSNWHFPILVIIMLAKLIHWFKGKVAKLEIILVD